MTKMDKNDKSQFSNNSNNNNNNKITNKENIDNDQDESYGEGEGISDFSQPDYMEAVREQLDNLMKNPQMLEKTMETYMEMQRKIMENPDKITKFMEGGKSDSEETLDLVKKIASRIVRLEKRLEEAGVLKPKE